MQGTTVEKLTLMFEMYDQNGNDYIDFNELHSIVKVLLKLKYSNLESGAINKFETLVFQDELVSSNKLPLSYNIAMYIMRKLDLNRNAKLSKQEFVDGCLGNEHLRDFLTPIRI